MEKVSSKSFEMAKQFLGKEVEVVFDRPLGSRHPKHGFIYEVNYGFIEGVKAPDGDDLDVYYLGTDKPLDKATGFVKAIIHRLNDDDDKLVVMPKDITISDDKIEKLVHFQEQFFKHLIIR
jgi:inorganic pyrophosphatase